MSDEAEKRLADRLTARAPAQRDPMFRVGVLEKRERRAYRRQNLITLGAAAVLGGAALIVTALKPALAAPVAIGVLVLLAAFIAYGYRGSVLRMARRIGL